MTNLSAKDLRIDNWVYGINTYDTEKTYFQVEKLDKVGINGDPVDTRITKYARRAEPIPLTPSIFESSGFDLVNGVYWTKNKISYEEEEFQGGIKEGTFAASTGIGVNPLPRPVKFVHELQNYHFALTGEELTINLNQLQQA